MAQFAESRVKVECHSENVLPGGGTVHCADIHQALVALQRVAAHLHGRQDARAIFPDIYAVITQTVKEASEGGYFLEPKFISLLGGCFASQYLTTLESSLTAQPQQAASWKLAYERAAAPDTLPLEHAALGINAHINYDLTLCIFQTLQRLGVQKNAAMLARLKRDHDSVNALLEKALPECLERLRSTYSCPATPLLMGTFRRMASRRILLMLCRWRERVWKQVLAMVDAEDEAARQRLLAKAGLAALREGQLMSALCRTSHALVH